MWIQEKFSVPKELHGLGVGAVCWAIWKARNKACFDNIIVKSPIEILCRACALMDYWAGLSKSELQEMIKVRVQALSSMAASLHPGQRVEEPRRMKYFQNGEEDDEAEEMA